MVRPETAFRPGGWLGALGRILAFAALFLVLAFFIGALWSLLPVPDDDTMVLAGTIVVALAALGAGAILIRVVDGRSPAALGIGLSRETPLHAAFGLGIGAAALAVATAGMLVTGALRYAAASGSAGAWLAVVLSQLALFMVAAFAEEVLFRGYAFQILARAAGPAVATVASSILFALAHGANPEVGAFALVNIFLAGVLLAVAYLRTLSLWFATALHVGWNWTMATLFDLPVSGIQAFDTPLYDPVIAGPDWWSGGMFGPEGGAVGSIGFVIALVAVLRWRRLRPDPRIAGAGALVLDRERGFA
jgi:uncharacterized protein